MRLQEFCPQESELVEILKDSHLDQEFPRIKGIKLKLRFQEFFLNSLENLVENIMLSRA